MRNSEYQSQPCQKQKEKLKLKISCKKTEEFPLKKTTSESTLHLHIELLRLNGKLCFLISTEKRLKQQAGNSSKENPIPLAQTLIHGRLSLREFLQPPLLPALTFPDPPLEAIMPSCLVTKKIEGKLATQPAGWAGF
ncbi:uncharacterized protein LOC117913889 [Vitis riparia]|uniref:uncharacterized protein LOC117913889 n=1 Tax=Vitis riparia TaxID=96939 RepID=UPI00155A79E3|nr:uncharacterized protein LOC117913889 [Vitis riparia]